MYKQLIIILLLLLYSSCAIKKTPSTQHLERLPLNEMRFGKNITIIITEEDIIDAVHLQKILDRELFIAEPYFDLWDNEELRKMIKYMKQNNYIIAPGKYIINQGWRFDDGLFINNNNEKFEVFEFKYWIIEVE